MYNKQKCTSSIRRVSELNNSVTKVKIIVTGKHAYAWSVTLIKESYNKTLTFAGRIPALKEYQRLITQFRQVGDCSLGI